MGLEGQTRRQTLWQLLAQLTPEELVALVDFRYLTDALTPEEALGILRNAEPARAQRTQELLEEGYPAYTTSPGWLGYSDEKLTRLIREALSDGFEQIKLNTGRRFHVTAPLTWWTQLSGAMRSSPE